MKITDWFEHDRFGMLIHWDLYSGPSGIWKGKRIRHAYSEWLQASEHIPRSEYRQLTEQFNPASFDADLWMRSAADAGMTSRLHSPTIRSALVADRRRSVGVDSTGR